jgi:Transglycosylase SLT domain
LSSPTFSSATLNSGAPLPQTSPVRASGSGEVRSAIARAAEATGVDFNYLLAQARLESGLNPSARAATSSATGLYQFTGATWMDTLARHGAAYGLDRTSINAPGMRAQMMALRRDPGLSAMMAGALANDNRGVLSGVLGREPDSAELYLAHFLGAEGASKFLSGLGSDPTQSAAALLPKAAAANRAIFFSGNGPRSVSAVMDLLRGKLDAAMGGTSLPGAATYAESPAAAPNFTGGAIEQEYQAAAADVSVAAAPRAASMADTLRSAFALGEGSTAPAHVRAAYGQLRALGI